MWCSHACLKITHFSASQVVMETFDLSPTKVSERVSTKYHSYCMIYFILLCLVYKRLKVSITTRFTTKGCKHVYEHPIFINSVVVLENMKTNIVT